MEIIKILLLSAMFVCCFLMIINVLLTIRETLLSSKLTKEMLERQRKLNDSFNGLLEDMRKTRIKNAEEKKETKKVATKSSEKKEEKTDVNKTK